MSKVHRSPAPPRLAEVLWAWDGVFVCAVITLGAFLRLPSLLHDGLSRDQANVYVQQSAPSFAEFFNRLTSTEYHPPLYFALAYFWNSLFGKSEFSYLFLPFLASVATIYVVFAIGTSASSPRVGLVAAFLYAISPAAIDNSTNYLYPIMGLESSTLVLLVVRARDTAMHSGAWLRIAALSTFVVYTHYVALIFVPLVALWALTSQRGSRHRIGLTSAILMGLATFVAWLPIFLSQRAIGIPYLSPPTLVQKLLIAFTNLVGAMPAAEFPIRILLVGVTLASVVFLIRRNRIEPSTVALGLVFLATLLAAALAGVGEGRYVVPFLGLLDISLAGIFVRFVASSTMLRTNVRAVNLATIVVALLLVTSGATRVYAANRPMLSGIASLTRSHDFDSHALYVIAPDYLAPTFAFYTQTNRPRTLGFVRLLDPEIFILKRYERDWNADDVVDRSFAAIDAAARTHAIVHYVVDAHCADSGRMPYGKVWTLLTRLKADFKLEKIVRYAGRVEEVDDYRFRVLRSATARP